MRRGAVIAGAGAALLALGLSGCAALPPWRHGVNPRDLAASPEAQALGQEAQAAVDRGDDPAALALLQQLAALTPRSPEAHYRLARVLQNQGRPAEAAASFRKAIELDHEYVAAMIGLGALEAASGRPAEALVRFDAAIELDPQNFEAHIARARALETMARPGEALAAYFRSLQFNPNAPEARLRVAALQLGQGQPDQALARLDDLVEQNPDDAEVRYLRGRAHLALGHNGPAADDLKSASTRLPDRPDVFYQLALALSASKDPEALRAAETALKLAPGSVEAQALTDRLRR